MKQICYTQHIQTSFYRKINESSRYFDMLTTSFGIMEDGMEVEQYMKFRNTLHQQVVFKGIQLFRRFG
jgi:tryptophan 2,3-dioxygenase